MRRRITWGEYKPMEPTWKVWVNGKQVSRLRFDVNDKEVLETLHVEADMPEPSHPQIPDGWELMKKGEWRGGDWMYVTPGLQEWYGKNEGYEPVFDWRNIYIQPIESKPEPRRFGSWEELQDYWLSGHSAVLYTGLPARLLSVESRRVIVQHKAGPVSWDWEYVEGKLAYPEGYDG